MSLVDRSTFLDEIISKAQEEVFNSSRALDYLHSRYVSDDQILDFGIGYFPDDYDLLVGSDRFKDWSNDGLYLQDKLVFPVKDPVGNTVGIHIRTPSHQEKDYMKFYFYFSKATARFFGIENAMPSVWETESVYLCEGLFDIFPLQKVVPNTICTLTASLTKGQFQFLDRFAEEIYIAFDHDDQGDAFFGKFKEDHRDSFRYIQRLKFKGEDVSECRSMLNEDRFKKLVESQRTGF